MELNFYKGNKKPGNRKWIWDETKKSLEYIKRDKQKNKKRITQKIKLKSFIFLEA